MLARPRRVDTTSWTASADLLDGRTILVTGAGDETLETALFARHEIPWDDIAFRSGYFALRKYLEDDGKNNGVHLHEVRYRPTRSG